MLFRGATRFLLVSVFSWDLFSIRKCRATPDLPRRLASLLMTEVITDICFNTYVVCYRAHAKPGETLLIHGASGGVNFFFFFQITFLNLNSVHN